jgi:hypothetical protein
MSSLSSSVRFVVDTILSTRAKSWASSFTNGQAGDIEGHIDHKIPVAKDSTRLKWMADGGEGTLGSASVLGRDDSFPFSPPLLPCCHWNTMLIMVVAGNSMPMLDGPSRV